jgi:hypothetical protein
MCVGLGAGITWSSESANDPAQGTNPTPPSLTCILPRRRGVIQAIEREPGVSGQRERVDGQRGEELRGFLVPRRGFSGGWGELGEAVGDEEDQVDEQAIGWAWVGSVRLGRVGRFMRGRLQPPTDMRAV